MPRQGPSKRPAADTTRLKRDIARNDSSIRANSRVLAESTTAGKAKSVLITDARRLFKEANAKQDTLNVLRKAAPKGGHKSFAKNTEGFDGRALTTEGSPKPPRVSIPRGNPTPDAIPSATGRPALARQSDGLENFGVATQTFAAGNTRATSSTGRGTRAAVDSFGGGV